VSQFTLGKIISVLRKQVSWTSIFADVPQRTKPGGYTLSASVVLLHIVIEVIDDSKQRYPMVGATGGSGRTQRAA
jgi:hypothetical protein